MSDADWQSVAADGILIAAGARAILLQIAHPAIGAGVAAHSDFSTRLLDRLHGTLQYSYAQVFGDAELRRLATHSVMRAHRPVRGEAHDADPAYNAHDPALQLWVAATLYETSVTMHEQIYGPLSDVVRLDLLHAYRPIATGLRVAEAAWPKTLAAFDAYWAEALTALDVTESARCVAQALLHPSRPVWLKPVMPFVRLITVGLMSEELREEFFFDWTDTRQRRFRLTMLLIRAGWRRLPRFVKESPRRRVLSQLSLDRV